MMAAYIQRSKPTSLAVQIRDAKRQVLNRQRSVDGRAATLVRKIHRQLTAPASLLLAGGIGFMIGELTKRPAHSRSIGDKPGSAGTASLKAALNLIASAHTLCTALPLVWMAKSFHQRGACRGKRPNGNPTASRRRLRR